MAYNSLYPSNITSYGCSATTLAAAMVSGPQTVRVWPPSAPNTALKQVSPPLAQPHSPGRKSSINTLISNSCYVYNTVWDRAVKHLVSPCKLQCSCVCTCNVYSLHFDSCLAVATLCLKSNPDYYVSDQDANSNKQQVEYSQCVLSAYE